jgi:adenylate cyclase
MGESSKPASIPTGAVFLSYASRDGEAAKRICEALRAAGIEVWFDQSELRGGDAWDAAIRSQVKQCALFIPLVSQNTDARSEGYFRREWHLAVQRMIDMAEDQVFLLPVVIDDTAESIARVPERFRERQWMRMPAGVASMEFTNQVCRLLGDRHAPASARSAPSAMAQTGTSLPVGSSRAAAASAASPAAQLGKPSLAVLPFVNMSGDSEQEYFADGIVEDIITALSRINQLFVIARNSSFTYKGRAVDVRQVAKELHVRYVLEGSVRKAGNRVRITGQLIDAVSGTHLWADRFEGGLEDVFELQDRVTENVVGAIEPTVKKAEIERARRKPADDLDAYDLYLRALPLVQTFRPDENAAAIRLLQRAIDLDPNYAPALAHAAWCYEQRISRGWAPFGADDAGAAVDLGRRVLATATDDAVALVLAGFVVGVVARDWDVGLDTSRRALRRNAGSGFVTLMASLCASFGGAPDDGAALAERAMALSPLDPAFFIYLLAAAFAQLFRGRPDEALTFAQQSIAHYAGWDTTYWVLITAYVQLGRLSEARTALAMLKTLSPGLTLRQIRTLGYRNPASVGMIVDALRTAGLPE